MGFGGGGLERGEEVRLERGLAGGGELRPKGGRGRRRAKPPPRVPEAAGDAPSAPAQGGDDRRH